jgi:RimJ/RimL family protein N-acetyltransferase
MSYAALPDIRTPRLTLRPLTDQDADAIVDGIGNFDVSKWLAVVPYPYSRDDAEKFIAKVHENGKPFWAICDADGLQGVVCLDDELAYWLARRVWGRGYGFEAAHAAVSYWFADPEAGDLMSGYFEGNTASGRLLSALGFVFKKQREKYAKPFQRDFVSNEMVLSRARWEARQDMTIYTPRLTIRPMDEADTGALVALAVPEVTRNLSRIPTGWTEDEALDFISESRFRGLPGFRLAIERDGQCIGGLGLGGSPLGIAYFLAPDHWGQGIATEALSAFLPEVFERFPLNTLVADHFDDNPASGVVLHKLGFKEIGREMGTSKGRLEPHPAITYALSREGLKVQV